METILPCGCPSEIVYDCGHQEGCVCRARAVAEPPADYWWDDNRSDDDERIWQEVCEMVSSASHPSAVISNYDWTVVES